MLSMLVRWNFHLVQIKHLTFLFTPFFVQPYVGTSWAKGQGSSSKTNPKQTNFDPSTCLWKAVKLSQVLSVYIYMIPLLPALTLT